MHLDRILQNILKLIIQKNEIQLSSISASEKVKLFQIIEEEGLLVKYDDKIILDEKDRSRIMLNILKRTQKPFNILKNIEWNNFEQIIAIIFSEIGFNVLTNFRFKDDISRYEIDVIAFNYPYILLIDCKFHRKVNLTSIKRAAEKQRERTEMIIERFPIISDELVKKLVLPLKRKIYAIPIIISWQEHTVLFHEQIAIVPFRYLQGFISELDELRDDLFAIELEVV